MVTTLNHQVGWWEYCCLEGNYPPVKERFEARFPMPTLLDSLMGGKRSLGLGHMKAKAFRPPNRPHKSSNIKFYLQTNVIRFRVIYLVLAVYFKLELHLPF